MDLRKVFDQTVRDLKREVNKKVLKVPEIEQKVLDATSNEPWGPHGTTMAELAHSTRNYNDYQMIMTILWKRLADTGKNWRHVYKSLTIFDYFVAHGAERVIDELREHVFQIQGLLDFQYVEPNGKDQGVNVRKKAQSLVALLNDKEKIREVRQKALANRDKYQGYSSTGGVSKPASYSSTGTRGYSDWDSSRGFSDWDDDKNGRKARESRYSVEDDSYDDDHKDNDKSHKSKSPYEESQKEYKGLNRKSPGTTAVKSSTVNDSDEDDFDPRAAKKPSSTATQAAAPAPEVDFFGQIDFFSTASTIDPFTAPASTPTPAPTVTTDMFASADSSDPFGTNNNDFGAFTAAPAAPAVSNGEDLFAGNPAFTAAPAATTSNSGDFFAADPFGQLSELQFESKPATKPLENLSSDASLNPFSGVKASQPATAAPTAPSFQTKSSVWADSLASGLIDLNITAPKSTTALADVGVQSTGLGSDWFREDSQSGFRGNAMGPGNGLGLGSGGGGGGGGAPPPSMTGGTNGFGFAGLESKQTKDEPFGGFGSPAKATSHHAFFNAGLKSSQEGDQFAIFP